MVANRSENWCDLFWGHAHFIEDREGHRRSDHRVIDAVDDVANVVEVGRNHSKLDLSLGCAEVF